MAKYPYIVNKNGIWHPAGTEVPGDADFTNEDKVVSQIDNNAIEITEDRNASKLVYTKTEINRMPIVELKELAIANGIKVDEDTTGSQLKKLLIEKFEL